VGTVGPDRELGGGEDGSPSGRRFPRVSRITKSDEIRSLFRRGKRRRTTHLDVFLAASPVSRPRVGIVVGKHGHDIVDRNRVRRRLREIARTLILPRLWTAGSGLDVLVRARPEAYGASYGELEREMEAVVEEACSRGPSSD
jgi:ribonuclease P protein component